MKIFQSILCIMLLGISVASWGQEKKAYRLQPFIIKRMFNFG